MRHRLAPVNAVTIDLTNCDKEPLHIPSAIQPHGLLIVMNKTTLNILQISNNANHFLGQAPEALLEKNIDKILSETHIEQIRQTVLSKDLEGNPLFLFTLILQCNNQDALFNAILHEYQGLLILELEPSKSEDETSIPSFYYFKCFSTKLLCS